MRRAPDLLKKRLAGDQLSGVAGHDLQQAEASRGIVETNWSLLLATNVI